MPVSPCWTPRGKSGGVHWGLGKLNLQWATGLVSSPHWCKFPFESPEILAHFQSIEFFPVFSLFLPCNNSVMFHQSWSNFYLEIVSPKFDNDLRYKQIGFWFFFWNLIKNSSKAGSSNINCCASLRLSQNPETLFSFLYSTHSGFQSNRYLFSCSFSIRKPTNYYNAHLIPY